MTNSNQLPSFLNVVSTEVRESKTRKGFNYAYLRVKGDDIETFVLPSGRVITAKKEVRETGTIAWEQNNLPTPTEDFGWNLKKGDTVMGAIVTRNVAPYTIPGNDTQVNTYSCVVFGDTRNVEEFEAKVRQAFKAAQHPITNVVAVETSVEVVADMMG